MKSIKRILALLAIVWLTFGALGVKAQCAMCATAIESNHKSGAKTASGLNYGIIYLLAAPYVAVAIVGFVWYKKYRRKNVELNVPHKKLNLN